jgi:hypothetical protein
MSLNPLIAAVTWFLSRGPAVRGPMGIGFRRDWPVLTAGAFHPRPRKAGLPSVARRAIAGPWPVSSIQRDRSQPLKARNRLCPKAIKLWNSYRQTGSSRPK